MMKHTTLARNPVGEWGKNEFAILGTSCDQIQRLAATLLNLLNKTYKTAYVDAKHQTENNEKNLPTLTFTDHINFSRLDWTKNWSEYEKKLLFKDIDLCLVNGNHFNAKQQIVIVDGKKDVMKKPEKLTSIQLFLKQHPDSPIPENLKKQCPDWEKIPVLAYTDTEKIRQFLENFIKEQTPPLYGLVLVGGKSTRMGQDKAQLNYHGKPQAAYMYEMLQNYCASTFLSCRAEQATTFEGNLACLVDSFGDLGQLGGILSAFRAFPAAAWLVVACDMPFLRPQTLETLIANRNAARHATAFWDDNKQFPEPLAAIYEPSIYFNLLQFLGLGYDCPRKVLINSDVAMIPPPHPTDLQNINFPEDYEQAKKKLV